MVREAREMLGVFLRDMRGDHRMVRDLQRNLDEAVGRVRRRVGEVDEVREE